MTKDEYLINKRMLKTEAEKKQYNLAKEFVTSNSTVKIGDFVKDHVGTIKVERISVSYGFSKDYPEATFYGIQYTKAGKPFKNGEKRSVWGGNLI